MSVKVRSTALGPRLVSVAEVAETLSTQEVVDALEAGLGARATAPAPEAERAIIDHPLGEFLVMPAAGPEGAGAKLVSIVPGNLKRGLARINGVFVLFSADGLLPELLLDGAALTRLRTAAVSALAARHLAPPMSRRLVVFGAGIQAEAHVAAISDLLPIQEVAIVASSGSSRRAIDLVERLRGSGVEAKVGRPEDVAGADVVCTCTPSRAPLFDGSLVPDGALVCAIGAYRPEMRELDYELLRRAFLVVETRAAALEEAGDLIQAIDAGVLAVSDCGRELGALTSGEVEREAAGRVRVFKSVGLPCEDLIVARAIADRLAGVP